MEDFDEYEDYDPKTDLWDMRDKTKENMSNKPENVRCPECQGAMVPRSGPHGIFWGCKGFPRCQGKRNSEGESPQEVAENRGEDYNPPEKTRYRFSK